MSAVRDAVAECVGVSPSELKITIHDSGSSQSTSSTSLTNSAAEIALNEQTESNNAEQMNLFARRFDVRVRILNDKK